MQQVTENEAHHYHETYNKTILGFWVYLMSDCVLFATLFAVYAVLHTHTFGGPSAQDLFTLPSALLETFILLTSSFVCGLAALAAHQNASKKVIGWLIVTFVLGISFLVIEGREFVEFFREGNSWERSAFLTSYFTLVGTHGLHISMGLLWMGVLLFQVGFRGITPFTLKRLTCFSLFWHFLDVVWIFIFTIVYLMGVK